MTISQDIVTRACSIWCFENVWNEPFYEGTISLRLYLTNPRFQTNAVIFNGMTLSLPIPSHQYAVFWSDYDLFEDSLIIPKNTWMSTDQLGMDHQTLFHVYSETGLMLPKASVFIYHDVRRQKVFIAVEKIPLINIVGLSNWNLLYLTVYRYTYSTLPKQVTIQSYQVSAPDPGNISAGTISAAIRIALENVPLGTFVYINGYDHIPSSTLTISPGDYVDIYTDRTVIGKYTVNLSSTPTGYFSSMYQVYKEILHCPKSVNPTNLITTTELLTLTARRNSDTVGTFIHRNEKNGITQVTHNDVAINTSIVDAYKASLGEADISIEVRIRAHDNTLIREINYIDYLYLNTDVEIVTFLIGHGDASLPFWTASSLEQSAYIRYMTSMASLIPTETLPDFVNGLGYYTVMAAICKHDKVFTIDATPVVDIVVNKPLILKGLPAYPLVYLNGSKLRDSQVDYINTVQDNVILGLVSGLYYTTGQTLTVELIETGSSIPYTFSPTSDTLSITVPFNGVSVYQINTLSTPTIGYNVTSSTSYTKITQSEFVAVSPLPTGGTLITFSPSVIGMTYLIQNAMFSRCYELDITDQVAAITPIHLELTTTCIDNVTVVPLVGYTSLNVYLNGRRMIEGIDYTANPITDLDGNPSIIQVMICNRSVLSLRTTNYLEVVAHTATTLNRTIGYVTNNTINLMNNVEMWYAGLSNAYANGYMLVNPTDVGDAIIPAVQITNGIPFMVLSEIPSVITQVMMGYISSADDVRISTINTYLNQKSPINDNTSLIIPRSWEVFSPYLTAICHDANQSNTITLYALDADPVLFKQQFSKYNYLLANDPTVGTAASEIDLRYCDIYPCYDTILVPDLNNYTAIRQLTASLLPSDSDTLGEVVND